MAADKHKKAAIRNAMQFEGVLADALDDGSDEKAAQVVGLGLSVLMHGLLYIGDRLGQVAMEIERKGR